MKQCPNCRTNYTDDALQFCLQDGTPLAEIPSQDAPTAAFNTESVTVVSPKQVEPIRFDLPSSYQTNQSNSSSTNSWQQPSQPVVQPVVVQAPAKKSKTAAIVLLTALGTLLLLGLGGIGAWFYLKNNKALVAANVNNNAPANRQTNNAVNSATANNQSLNSNLANASPSPTPSAQPTLNPKQSKEITEDVKNVVDVWKSASENLDIDDHMSQYANTVDYYKGGRVSLAKVRADKEKAYSAYDSININISNMKITPDSSGEKATALFDKEWTFEGENKYSSGKVQQQLTLQKINDRWLITGEKDLKVYYVNN
jgi:hypothetical protein